MNRSWIASFCGTFAAMTLAIIRPAVAQTQSPPPEEEVVSYAAAVEKALTEAMELVDALEENTQRDQSWVTNYTDAAKRSNAVLETDPLNVKARYIQGRLAILQGKPRDALPLIEAYAADKIGAADWKAHKLLGDLFLVSYAEQARMRYNEAAKLAPDRSEPLIGLAKALIKLNRGEEAVANARSGIQNDKKRTASYRRVLAEALLLMPDQQREAAAAARESVQINEQAIRENPENLALFSELQEAYTLLLRCCDRQFEVDKNSPEIIVDVARTMQDQADLERLISYHKAMRLIEEARKREMLRGSPVLMFEEARLARLLGRDARAVEVLKELLEAQPDHDAARELLGVIESTAGTTTPSDGVSSAAEPRP